ncbi:MAG: hypothetical protein QM831_36720 [Kofleriaceae bacterium]
MTRLIALLLVCGTAQAGPKCFDGVQQKERERVFKALDTELQKTGGHILMPQGVPMLGAKEDRPGTVITTRDGSHWMVLYETQACGGISPDEVWAIDGKGVVFSPKIEIHAKTTRQSLDCGGPCGGCGHVPPRIVVGVAVPADATLATDARTIRVPMDEHFEVKVVKKVCQPVP